MAWESRGTERFEHNPSRSRSGAKGERGPPKLREPSREGCSPPLLGSGSASANIISAQPALSPIAPFEPAKCSYVQPRSSASHRLRNSRDFAQRAFCAIEIFLAQLR